NSVVSQHAAGKCAWVAGRSRAGGRRRNDLIHLILRNHRLLSRSGVLLWRRCSGAPRLVLPSRPLLRRYGLLSSGIAAAGRGRSRGGSAARSARAGQILLVVRLRNFRVTPAAGIPAADFLLSPCR